MVKKFFVFLVFFFFSQACLSCVGKVSEYPYAENEYFTGICDENGNRTEGIYLISGSEYTTVFFGFFKENAPYVGRLISSSESSGEEEYIDGIFNYTNGEIVSIIGSYVVDDQWMSSGTYNNNFYLHGFGFMPSQTSFDFVIGEFSEGKLSGKAKYYDSEESDAELYANYNSSGRLNSQAYLYTQAGERITLNYVNNQYRGYQNNWHSNNNTQQIQDYVVSQLDAFEEIQEMAEIAIEKITDRYNSGFYQEEEVGDPTYAINEPQNRINGTGTGFFVSKNLVVTNNHVVHLDEEQKNECRNIKGRLGFEEFELEIVSKEYGNDLALLKTEFSNQDIAKIRVRGVRKGEKVFSVGYPLSFTLGEGAKITEGRVSSLSGIRNDSSTFQISADIAGGNSGGPLLDDKGNVIGVSVSGLKQEYSGGGSTINFGIKSLTLAGFLETNRVSLDENLSNRIQDVPDLVEKAEKYTLLIQCYE